MPLPGRKANPGSYRYGFNGKELDANGTGMGGGGNTYDYGFRIYNPQIAKFLSVDPLAIEYPWYSPYHFAGNSPIANIDRDGLEPENFTMHIDGADDIVFELVDAQTIHQVVESTTEPNGDVQVASLQGYVAVYQYTYETNEPSLWSSTKIVKTTTTIVVTSIDGVVEIHKHIQDDVYKPPVEVNRHNLVRKTEYTGQHSTTEDPQNELIKEAAIAVALTKLGESVLFRLTTKQVPNGFKNSDEFFQAAEELKAALKESSLPYENVGVRGSSVTNQSSKGGGFRELPEGGLKASDIDFYVEFTTDVGLSTSKNIPGFVHPNKLAQKYPALDKWAQKWSKKLNRDVSVGGFNPGNQTDDAVIIVD